MLGQRQSSACKLSPRLPSGRPTSVLSCAREEGKVCVAFSWTASSSIMMISPSCSTMLGGLSLTMICGFMLALAWWLSHALIQRPQSGDVIDLVTIEYHHTSVQTLTCSRSFSCLYDDFRAQLLFPMILSFLFNQCCHRDSRLSGG